MTALEHFWHQLEQHVQQRPDKIALADEQGSIAYADLSTEVQQRADRLRALGCRFCARV